MTEPGTISGSVSRDEAKFGRVVLAAGFLVSGASALVYQVAWQRILALQSGVGIYSVAMIVAAFMAGLGIGSYVGAWASRGMAPRRALHIFAIIELGIGGFGLLSSWIFYDLLYSQLGWLFAVPWRAGLIQFISLLLPTTLMGMSLPFLAQVVVSRSARAAPTLGLYYGLNAIGAALGALATTWFLIRFFGISGAISIGAAGNLLVGIAVLTLARCARTESVESSRVSSIVVSDITRDADTVLPFIAWVTLYAVSGFCALSLEMLWFRILDVAVKSTAFTFGTVLAIFLLGLGAGSAFGGVWAQRLRHPLRAFLVCQSMLLALSGLSLVLLVALPADTPGLAALVEYWAQYNEFPFGQSWDWSNILGLYLGLPLFLYGIPTLLMGFSFGILQRAVQNDLKTTGFKVGVLQAANISGNVAGSLLTGLVLLAWLGTTGSVRLLLVIGAGFAILGILKTSQVGSRLTFPLLLLVLAGTLVMLPNNDAFWRRLHGTQNEATLIGEDATGVAAIGPDGTVFRVTVNGKGHSYLPFGGVHTLLGAAPAALHPAPRRVAIIGLGSGDTAWAAAFRPVTERVDVFELIAPEHQLLERLSEREKETLPKLRQLLIDERVHIHQADGRAALALGNERYDIIEADALRPHSAYSGNLYSVEFFEMCSQHLTRGGFVATWAPTPRIRSSLFEVFEHVVEIPGWNILIASQEPIELAHALWQQLATAPTTVEYLGHQNSSDVASDLATVREADARLTSGIRPNRDIFPRDEFLTPFGGNIDDAQLFWQSEDGLKFTEENSSVQCAVLDNEWRIYRFPISADSTSISKLRLDFVREFSFVATVDVRAILAGTSNTENTLRVKIGDVECNACRVTHNGELLSIDKLEFDPFVQFSVAPPLSPALEFVQLEMRIEPRRMGPLNWLTQRVRADTSIPSCIRNWNF